MQIDLALKPTSFRAMIFVGFAEPIFQRPLKVCSHRALASDQVLHRIADTHPLASRKLLKRPPNITRHP
tara:strand:+ start:1533 stop:1739 length:207 start_codon:yes stop_codon:yes gene_type:complete